MYRLVALPAGTWVERRSQRTLIAFGIALWSLCTLLTGPTQNFRQIVAARTVLGIGKSSRRHCRLGTRLP